MNFLLTFIFSAVFSFTANAKNFSQIHTALLNDSDFQSPTIKKKIRSLEYLQDETELNGEYVFVQMTDGSKCHFDSSLADWSRPDSDPCALALQIYYSATKSARYFESLGFSLPKPVKIFIQDDSLGSDLGRAGGDTIRFKYFPSDKISLWMQPIIDVVFHEMTHIAESLNNQLSLLIHGKLAVSFIEGAANLFAYLQSGRTDLGVLNGSPGMQVLTDIRFGRLSPGNYATAESFTSVLAELTNEMIRTAPVLSPDEIARIAGKIYLQSFFQLDDKSNYQDYFKKISAGLNEVPAPLNAGHLISFLQKALFFRGLDLHASQTDGQVSGFLIQGFALDYLKYYLFDILSTPSTTTTVQAQVGMKNDPEVKWPLKGFLISLLDVQTIAACANQEFANLPQEQQRSPNAFNFASIACLEKSAKTPLAFPGISISNRVMNFSEPGAVFSVNPERTNEPCGDIPSAVFAWVFDQAANKTAELSMPVKCR